MRLGRGEDAAAHINNAEPQLPPSAVAMALAHRCHQGGAGNILSLFRALLLLLSHINTHRHTHFYTNPTKLGLHPRLWLIKDPALMTAPQTWAHYGTEDSIQRSRPAAGTSTSLLQHDTLLLCSHNLHTFTFTCLTSSYKCSFISLR